jgi:hypothetical protein
MNHGRSFTLATLALLVLYVLAYLARLLESHVFALPPAWGAWLVLVTPIADYVLAYAIHGLATGDWAPPLPLAPVGANHGPPSPPAG